MTPTGGVWEPGGWRYAVGTFLLIAAMCGALASGGFARRADVAPAGSLPVVVLNDVTFVPAQPGRPAPARGGGLVAGTASEAAGPVSGAPSHNGSDPDPSPGKERIGATNHQERNP